MCDCWLDEDQMQRPQQLVHWPRWCHIVLNSMRWLKRPMMNHCPNVRPDCHWLCLNSRQHVSPVCMLMVELVSNYFEYLNRPMCSTHLCSHLFRMIQFWHNLCCRFHRRVLCMQPLYWHRMVNLVLNGIDVNDDLRMVSYRVTMENLCMRLLHFGHDVQPMSCSCRMFDADDHKIRSVQNTNSYWRECLGRFQDQLRMENFIGLDSVCCLICTFLIVTHGFCAHFAQRISQTAQKSSTCLLCKPFNNTHEKSQTLIFISFLLFQSVILFWIVSHSLSVFAVVLQVDKLIEENYGVCVCV